MYPKAPIRLAMSRPSSDFTGSWPNNSEVILFFHLFNKQAFTLGRLLSVSQNSYLLHLGELPASVLVVA